MPSTVEEAMLPTHNIDLAHPLFENSDVSLIVTPKDKSKRNQIDYFFFVF